MTNGTELATFIYTKWAGQNLNTDKLKKQKNQDHENDHEISGLVIRVITCMYDKQSRHMYQYD